MFQITLVSEIITIIQATVATLENTLSLPNLCNWIHTVWNSINLVSYQKVWWSYETAMGFCARKESAGNSVNVFPVPCDWICTAVDLYRGELQ